MPTTIFPTRACAALLFSAALSVAFTPLSASAHFTLDAPAAATQQNATGDPQKAPPCGDDGSAVATGKVTPYVAGGKLTVTINETIYHPGHYRIALALNNPSELPAEPPVTAGTTPCGSAPIDAAPKFPVLADGVFKHSSSFSGPQTIEITLPKDVTCTKCTLQVIEFMSNHALNNPGGCYYHHCANISISASGGGSTGGDGGSSASTGSADDAGASGSTTSGSSGGSSTGGDGGGSASSGSTGDAGASGDAGSGSNGGDSGGCALATGTPASDLTLLLAAIGVFVVRTRRRA